MFGPIAAFSLLAIIVCRTRFTDRGARPRDGAADRRHKVPAYTCILRQKSCSRSSKSLGPHSKLPPVASSALGLERPDIVDGEITPTRKYQLPTFVS